MDPIDGVPGDTQAQTCASSISELTWLFECPVCRDYALPPILQCENGHHLCATCRENVSSCPLCRAPKGRNRNLALDKLAETALFPCKYFSTGCTEALLITAKEKHEMTCEYGPASCVLGRETCKWTGPLRQLVDHVLQSHGFIRRFQGENIAITAARFDREEAFSWLALQTCLGRDFVVVLKTSSNDSSCKQFIALVSLVGYSQEARNFAYRLQLSGPQHRLTWEARMQGIYSLTECVESRDCLLLDLSTARFLCNDADLIMDISISHTTLCGDKFV